jgi:NAD(P)-dependent dehydrogenase (short-subunit alcohol dehydrogenase family)
MVRRCLSFHDPKLLRSLTSPRPLLGLTESLAPELSSFGIRVLLLVPGDMRTSFISPANVATNLVPLSEAYKGTMVDHVTQAVIAMHGKQPTDPRKAAERIMEMVLGTGVAGEVVGRGPDGQGSRLGRTRRR